MKGVFYFCTGWYIRQPFDDVKYTINFSYITYMFKRKNENTTEVSLQKQIGKVK